MNSLHAPFLLSASADQCKGLVVFIHGFLGGPGQFDEYAKVVHKQGFSAAALLLPGHGGSAKDFGKGTFELWQGFIDSEIERFSKVHADIWLVGHSMGGLLAINAAVRYSGFVRGVFMIACPFRLVIFSFQALKVRFIQVFGNKKCPIKTTYLDRAGVPISPGLILNTAKPAAELKNKLMPVAKDNLANIRVPVVAVYSTSDELTSIHSLDILKSGLPGAQGAHFEQIVLTDSLHGYYPEHERTIIEKALLKFISQ